MNLWDEMARLLSSELKLKPNLSNQLPRRMGIYRRFTGNPIRNSVVLIPYRFSDCAVAMGFHSISDTNAPDAPPDGIATLDSTVNKNNQRVSTFHAFLPREIALSREKNLTICTNAIVSRVVFSHDGEKPRTDKVLFTSAQANTDKIFSVNVRKEVIICSGAIGSPKVLMLRYFDFLFPESYQVCRTL